MWLSMLSDEWGEDVDIAVKADLNLLVPESCLPIEDRQALRSSAIVICTLCTAQPGNVKFD